MIRLDQLLILLLLLLLLDWPFSLINIEKKSCLNFDRKIVQIEQCAMSGCLNTDVFNGTQRATKVDGGAGHLRFLFNWKIVLFKKNSFTWNRKCPALVDWHRELKIYGLEQLRSLEIEYNLDELKKWDNASWFFMSNKIEPQLKFKKSQHWQIPRHRAKLFAHLCKFTVQSRALAVFLFCFLNKKYLFLKNLFPVAYFCPNPDLKSLPPVKLTWQKRQKYLSSLYWNYKKKFRKYPAGWLTETYSSPLRRALLLSR